MAEISGGSIRAQATWQVPDLMAFVRRYPAISIGFVLMLVLATLSIAAPVLSPYDPLDISPGQRLRPPSFLHLFGTDALGRDVFSRTLWGGRVSLLVGVTVAAASVLIGLVVGVLSGYIRAFDFVVMRIMDGLMAIPAILVAVAIATMTKGSIGAIIVSISIAEIPRVVRLVRSLVLGVREQSYIEAAKAIGTPTPYVIIRHILPNIVSPLIVQATYICASAVIVEAYLSFLGAGTPPDTPSWGNIMAEGRAVVQLGFWVILYPGLFLAATVLSINMLGDGLRDLLDPHVGRRI
ncbi:ABC transporter permease [Bradyrhizobium sp. NP1]|uniref:ABC transporter permease n=1 Tax=Bradyrhizobium sp. NP1 TaxID=3049772 RepID=UPI0025A55981|nr:ABC transporter permease [Bradyrhizobium sp. NP1]WJR79219.1 ABC transporter permease [Bradyrhizobium sp. NP1]